MKKNINHLRKKILHPLKNEKINEKFINPFNTIGTTPTNTSSNFYKYDNKKFLKTTYTIDTFYTNLTNDENKVDKKITTMNIFRKGIKNIQNEKIKKENEANKFLNYLKNHFSYTNRERKNNDIYDPMANFKITKKPTNYSSISGRVKEMKTKTEFIRIITNYIYPIFERTVNKKKLLNRKALLENKIKILKEKNENERRYISLDTHMNHRNYVRISALYNSKYENNDDMEIENLKNRLSLL